MHRFGFAINSLHLPQTEDERDTVEWSCILGHSGEACDLPVGTKVLHNGRKLSLLAHAEAMQVSRYELKFMCKARDDDGVEISRQFSLYESPNSGIKILILVIVQLFQVCV